MNAYHKAALVSIVLGLLGGALTIWATKAPASAVERIESRTVGSERRLDRVEAVEQEHAEAIGRIPAIEQRQAADHEVLQYIKEQVHELATSPYRPRVVPLPTGR